MTTSWSYEPLYEPNPTLDYFFILLETGGHLLQETSGKIIEDQSDGRTNWAYENKN